MPKTGEQQLSTAGATEVFFSDCDDCYPFLIVSLKGTFELRGADFLEFKVATSNEIVLAQVTIGNPGDNEVTIDLNEDPTRGPSVAEYFVRIEDFTSLDSTTMIFSVTRKNRRGVWKYTKASGPIGAPKKKRPDNFWRRIERFSKKRSL